MKTFLFWLLASAALFCSACTEGDEGPACGPDDCHPHGSCVEGPNGPYCDCDEGYVDFGHSDLVCVEDLSCIDDSDCSTGFCKNGFCSSTDCVTDNDCGPGRCCVEIEAAYFICLKIADGYACGDGTGTCGDSCTGTIDSACAIDNPCLRADDLSPKAICSQPCETDLDCADCQWSEDPDATLACVTITGGAKYCIVGATDPDPIPCISDLDCPDDEHCGFGLYTEFWGLCGTWGLLPPGAACDPDSQNLPFEERCVNLLCLSGSCSLLCQVANDCPEGMSCQTIDFCIKEPCDDPENLIPGTVCAAATGE